jgi:hypothetical protein
VSPPMTSGDDELTAQLKAMREDELFDFIRDTVARLNALGDRLEDYVTEREASRGSTHLSSVPEPGETDGKQKP